MLFRISSLMPVKAYELAQVTFKDKQRILMKGSSWETPLYVHLKLKYQTPQLVEDVQSLRQLIPMSEFSPPPPLLKTPDQWAAQSTG
ncbi:hypothetical protein CDAR_542751 [Caerostris darwini]|uniref:Uncharacterized protein n=1 Tax=Caerostris darwini TaxID=1538125 RepID=A0AAV4WWU6_9ARAC|nr:hypothetical protein CDAR_542751 [Caerostris darwini]